MLTILTASDSRYFSGVQLLFESLAPWHYRFICYDLGLVKDQQDWLREAGMERRIISKPVMPPWVLGWQTWNKPFYFYNLPPGQYLWLDADCYVADKFGSVLRSVLSYLQESPLILQHWSRRDYVQPNSPKLYERFPVQKRFSATQSIHANIVGLSLPRDAGLLALWAYMVRACSLDETVRSLVTWYDEGALHWAVQAMGLTGVLADRPEWDQTLTIRKRSKRETLEELANVPQGIIHFAAPKPWESWEAPALV